MKRHRNFIGSLGLGMLVAGCSSGASEGPAPFDASLESQLEAEFGAPFAVDSMGGQAFVASALARTRAVAKTHDEALAAAQRLFTVHGAAFGATRELPSLAEVEGDADPSSIHLAQLVPGTQIEVVGKGALLHLDADGTLLEAVGAFVDAPRLDRPVVTTAADVEKRVSALAAGWSLPDASPPEIVDAPRLVATPTAAGLEVAWHTTFRVDLQGFQARFDATSLEPLEVVRAQAGLDGVPAPPSRAKGLFSYPLAQLVDPIAKRDLLRIETTQSHGGYTLLRAGTATASEVATKECTGLSANERTPKSEDIWSPTNNEFLGQFVGAGFKVNGVGLVGPGIAVNVHHNALEVDKHFRALFGGEGPSGQGKLVGLIHANDRFAFHTTGPATFEPDGGRFGASWDPVTNLVSFGDGGYLPSAGAWIKPPGVALDVAAHEWAHAYISRKARLPLVGEGGAMQEGIADAIGAFVAARAGEADFKGIGKGMRLDGAYVRSFANPGSTQAPASPAPDPDKPGHTISQRPTPMHRAGMDNACAFRGPDQGCVHYNAGPLDYAFFLMVNGGRGLERKGVQDSVAVRVVAGDLAKLERVWTNSAKAAPNVSPPEPVRGEIRFMKLEAMALQQVNYARSLGDARTTAAVGCAWLGVGFVTRAQLAARGVACSSDDTERAAGPSDCGGKTDGYHCDAASPFSGTLCRGGGVAGGMQCAAGRVCARKSPSSTEARVTPEGAMECEEAL